MKKEYGIIYETYNNSDFSKIVFVKTKKEADTLMRKLQKLKHVTKVVLIGGEKNE